MESPRESGTHSGLVKSDSLKSGHIVGIVSKAFHMVSVRVQGKKLWSRAVLFKLEWAYESTQSLIQAGLGRAAEPAFLTSFGDADAVDPRATLRIKTVSRVSSFIMGIGTKTSHQ